MAYAEIKRMMDTESVLSEWRFFDNGGETFDRYSIWEGDCYLGCSEHPCDPQGFGQHGEGQHPDMFGDQLEDRIGKEIEFADLPADVQKAVKQDAGYYVADYTAQASADKPIR